MQNMVNLALSSRGAGGGGGKGKGITEWGRTVIAIGVGRTGLEDRLYQWNLCILYPIPHPRSNLPAQFHLHLR